MIGQTLGNYRIIEQIGLGGMATVYKAYDADTDRYVALKVLPHHFSHDPTFRERFQREAKAIAKLEHLHILPIFSYGEDNGVAYMAMRYLRTGTLTERIRQGPLPLPEASRLLSQIASALDHAHAHGVLHRDIKPSNVLLDEAGNAYLTDFGIAKIVETTLDLTRGNILGTPAYMSPEQCQGVRELTPASDIYSLGIVLYEMVTGRTPYQAETPIALIHMQLNQPLPLPRTIRPNLPEAAEKVILKALAKPPESRHASCSEMAAAFARAVAGQPAGVPAAAAAGAGSAAADTDATLIHSPADEPTLVPSAAAASLGRFIWPIAALLLLLLVGGGVAIWQLLANTSPPPTPSPPAAAVLSPTQTAPAVPTPTSPPPPTVEPTPNLLETLPAERYAQPCDWRDDGPGMCIYSPDGDDITPILVDAGLEITDVAAWSPDGRQLILSARNPKEDSDIENRLYLFELASQQLTPLPQNGNDLFPAWSPDGEWVVFHSSGNLRKMRVDGSKSVELLTQASAGCGFYPQWSPDSERIVVALMKDCSWDFPLTRDLWIVSAAGKKIERIARTEYTHDCDTIGGVFSADGQRVAYFDADCRPQLVETDTPQPIEEFPWTWANSFSPQWFNPAVTVAPGDAISPAEARWLGSCHYTDAGGEGVCLFDFNDELLGRFLEDEGFNPDRFWGFGWHPNGEQVVISAGKGEFGDGNDNQPYILNLNTGQLTHIPLDGNLVDPAWSPNGEWIAAHLSGRLVLFQPDGGGFRTLYDGEACLNNVQWSPDSSLLVTSFQTQPLYCDDKLPKSLEIRILSITGGRDDLIAATRFEKNTCPDVAAAVAFNPNGEEIVYYDANCRPQSVSIENPADSYPLNDFPWQWNNHSYPQWATINYN